MVYLQLFSALFFLSYVYGKNSTLKALWNLEEMTVCRLHYNALVYNNYGCWCGVGGDGNPMDGIDRCCMWHDKCYDMAIDKKQCRNVPFEYLRDYSWHCADGEPVCKENLSECQTALCHCDKAVVDCWSQFPKPIIKAKCGKSLENRTIRKHNRYADQGEDHFLA